MGQMKLTHIQDIIFMKQKHGLIHSQYIIKEKDKLNLMIQIKQYNLIFLMNNFVVYLWESANKKV